MRNYDENERKAALTAAEFNELYPVGTRVRFYPLRGEPQFEESRTRSVAWALGHGDVVVLIEGRTGGVSIEPYHLRIMEGGAG